ncbi:hypothetical protein M0813_02371 [Anaeramoeba flamelloides]|uniref:Uncharacterized protein n=1 Tax=Anaeramoeba flamelloides TaxID=1746091 RepID=A0ABQ8YIK0_9EUKA|nr:hypothetical protein M0813_02371 [Anaeramoeba flamelloides]
MIAIPTRKRTFVPLSETEDFNKNEFISNKNPRKLNLPNKILGNRLTRINHPSLRQIEQRKRNKEKQKEKEKEKDQQQTQDLNSNLLVMKNNFSQTNNRQQDSKSKFSKYLDSTELKLHQQNQRLLNNHFYPTYQQKNMKKETLYTTLEVKTILSKLYKGFTKEKQKQYEDLLNQRYSEQLRIFTITNQQTTGEQKINSSSYIN